MKYYRKINNVEFDVDTRFSNYENRYALRSELGIDVEKNNDWYNDIYAKSELTLNPNLEWYEYVTLTIGIIILSMITGCISSIFNYNAYLISILSFFMYYIVFIIYKIINVNKYNISKVNDFNELKIIEQTDEWIDKDDNGDRYIIFYSYDSDLDHTQLKLTDSEYNLLKKYRYEIEHNYSFPNYDEIIDDLETRSKPTLYIDLKLLSAIII